MPFQPSVQSVTRLGTAGVTESNLGATCFITTSFATKNRSTSYISMEEVRNDTTVSVNSNTYKGARTFFSQVGAAVPFYVGRRSADDITFTPTTISNTAEYTFDIQVYDTTTLVGIDYTVSITSDSDATAEDIATALYTEVITTQAIPDVTGVDNAGSVTFTPAAGHSFVITNTSDNLTESYTTTETAATVFSAVNDEIGEDYYFTATDDKTETFVLALADEVEATASSDFVKTYAVTLNETTTLTPLPDPAVDILGKLKEGNYSLTHGEWNHDATTKFPELSMLAIMGSLFPGTSNWKFKKPAAIEAARHPVTDRLLTTAEQGYVADRNANWVGVERGVPFYREGTKANGEWIDIMRGAHFINDRIEARLLNLQINTSITGGKISFLSSDQQRVLGVIESVLSEGVTRKILTGYIPPYLEVAPSFEDQVTRTLDDIKWVGYLAGAVNTILVDGVLTYADEALA